MQFGQRLGQGKPQTGALGGVLHAVLDLLERQQDAAQVAGFDAGAGIGDGDLYAAAVFDAGIQGDAAAGRGELDGVGQQVEENLLQPAPVATKTADGNGSFHGTFTVPLNVSIPSTNTVKAFTRSDEGGTYSAITHTVPEIEINISPKSGAPNSLVTVCGSGFKTYSTVTVMFGG